jgi:hypothetical protein
MNCKKNFQSSVHQAPNTDYDGWLAVPLSSSFKFWWVIATTWPDRIFLLISKPTNSAFTWWNTFLLIDWLTDWLTSCKVFLSKSVSLCCWFSSPSHLPNLQATAIAMQQPLWFIYFSCPPLPHPPLSLFLSLSLSIQTKKHSGEPINQ